jgi:ligand-binding SRPBCC domain-containing protein
LTVPPNQKDVSGGRGEQPRKPRLSFVPLSFITDQWVPFHAPETESTVHAAGRGSRILLSFRPLPLSPIRLRWLALIDDYMTDHHFCDLQVTGPFGYWRHCHLVRAEAHGEVEGTRVTDVVDYQWLRGWVGRAIDALGGRLQIRQLFRYRQRQLLRLLPDHSRT